MHNKITTLAFINNLINIKEKILYNQRRKPTMKKTQPKPTMQIRPPQKDKLTLGTLHRKHHQSCCPSSWSCARCLHPHPPRSRPSSGGSCGCSEDVAESSCPDPDPPLGKHKRERRCKNFHLYVGHGGAKVKDLLPSYQLPCAFLQFCSDSQERQQK